MKVAIVTFVRAYNYGAVLQAYALNKVINDMGIECQVIDYYPDSFRKEYLLKRFGSFRIKPSRNVKFWFRNNYLFLKVKKRSDRFDRFITKQIKVTKTQFHNFEEIKHCEEFDIYISGSDQVWCPYLCDFDKTFYLVFCDKEKRFSYAASFGVDKIPDDLVSEYEKRLSGWKRYSVREESGAKIIEQLLGEKAVCCCDPTILLSNKEWSSLGKRKSDKEFIVLYFVNESKKLFEYARKLSEKKNLDVYCLHSNMQPKYFKDYLTREYGFKIFSTASPIEFIRFFRDASYVLTNSFHGTVFSVVFHKNFLSQIVLDDGRSNGRIITFLDETRLSHRCLNNQNLELINDKIDWNYVDNLLDEIRKNGMNYLFSILSDDC